jgi:hypothetical protein
VEVAIGPARFSFGMKELLDAEEKNE